MIKGRGLFPIWCLLALLLASVGAVRAEEAATGEESEKPAEVVPTAYPPPKAEASLRQNESGTITVNLKNTPLQDFLGMVTQKTGKRFVIKPEVKDIQITAYLPDIRLDEALAVMLSAYDLEAIDYGSGVMLVSKKVKKREPPKQEAVQPPEALQVEVVQLRYADANDMKETLAPLLSERGSITVVKRSGLEGWTFGAGRRQRGAQEGGSSAFGPRERTGKGYAKEVRSQLLVISETAAKLELLKDIIEKIDVRAKQVLISTTIVEAGRDKLKDIGFDWATGSFGVETSDISVTKPWGGDLQFRGNVLGSRVTPGNFGPEADMTGAFPFNAGMSMLLKKVGGTEFEILIHALEELADANVLSAPKLLVLDNQEAAILVGTKFPILETETTGVETTQLTTSLDYYENIGIQLMVAPHIQDGKYINMVVHPVVSDQIGVTAARGSAGEILAEYPILSAREAQTQIMIEHGQTIAIGGLLKDVKTESIISVPLLGDIPILGALFRRKTYDTKKVDLIIFLSASIISEPGEATEEKMRVMDRKDESLANSMLQQSMQLQEQGRYQEALALLTALQGKAGLLVSEKARSEMAQRIKELQQLIADTKDESLANSTLERALELQKEGDYPGAVELLTALQEKSVLRVSDKTRKLVEQRVEELRQLMDRRMEILRQSVKEEEEAQEQPPGTSEPEEGEKQDKEHQGTEEVPSGG